MYGIFLMRAKAEDAKMYVVVIIEEKKRSHVHQEDKRRSEPITMRGEPQDLRMAARRASARVNRHEMPSTLQAPPAVPKRAR